MKRCWVRLKNYEHNLDNMDALRPLSIEDIQKNLPYHVGSLFTLKGAIPYKRTLPCIIPNEWVFSQLDTDLCSGCASANASAVQEGMRLDPGFPWMLARENDGMRVDEFGANLRSIGDAHRKFGDIELKDSPYTFTDRDKIADPTKWDIAGLLKKSVYHKKGGITWVNNFDEARQAIERLDALYKKPHTVIFGLKWGYLLTDRVIENIMEDGSGHAILMTDWEGDYAIVLNSYGLQAGEMGYHRLHRRIFDRWAKEFGAGILIDETEENVKWAVQNGVKLDGNWLLNVLKAFANALKDLLARLNEKVGEVPPYLWDTPEHSRYNVRHICDSMGLIYEEKNLICACIMQESGFDNNAVCRNKNNKGEITSSDWGIVQCNDYWHVGEGKEFPSSEYIVAHPEEAVRWMITMYKAGYLKLWVSYSSGAYKKWLKSESRPGMPY
jgi:hypothetical protein